MLYHRSPTCWVLNGVIFLISFYLCPDLNKDFNNRGEKGKGDQRTCIKETGIKTMRWGGLNVGGGDG